MRRIVFFLFIISPFVSFAKAGDTLWVQTFTFKSKQDSTFLFPKDSFKSYKILMYYTLKCTDNNNPKCGEWDYLTYTFLYKKTGKMDSSIKKIDTTFNSDSTIKKIDTTWKKFDHLERYELGRYITPYGIGLNLGNGFTWIYDVTDYAPLLHDSVRLTAGNWQEYLDLKFAFVEGISPRKPYKVENLWNGNFGYGTATSIENALVEKNISIDSGAFNSRIKLRVTGHGFGGNENCSEFCAKLHSFTVDSNLRFQQLVWRESCPINPVYPQGGTWVYQRANWCPGSDVTTYNFELTPFVIPGKASLINYNVEPYTWNGKGSTPYYAIETQLISYEKPAFKLDAAVDDIIYPSTKDIYRRMNPECGKPLILIKNTGTDLLQSLTITYGMKGGTPATFNWKGAIPFMETDSVWLNPPAWDGPSTNAGFYVNISSPNGGTDAYEPNNKMSSFLPFTNKIDNDILVFYKTNLTSDVENRIHITDASGKVFYERIKPLNNKLYQDTVHLPNGCFKLLMEDDGEDGLSFWANKAQGDGFISIYNLNHKLIKYFGADFGRTIEYNFTTGYGMSINETKENVQLLVFPNPSSGKFIIDVSSFQTKNTLLEVTDMTGKIILKRLVDGPLDELDLSGFGEGIYLLRIHQDNQIFTQKLSVLR